MRGLTGPLGGGLTPLPRFTRPRTAQGPSPDELGGHCDISLENLAGRPVGQRIDDEHRAWVFVRCDAFLRESPKLLRRRDMICFERDHSDNFFPVHRVRDADDRRLEHGRVFV